ncbi:hypothetical protein IWX75_003122 [Arthrobacter sp. CAN_A6]|uniref:hypothetical protein n=1 Tax=Arthrobacter sp. CAN_A6 TaxID=2787721 RepID=UPI0018C8EB95
MNDSIYVISVSFMLILLGGLTFHRMTSRRTPEGARALLRPSGRLALMGVLLTAAYVFSLPGVYEVLEAIVPISNGTDFIAKCCAMTAVAVLGVHLALAYGSETAIRWIVGVRGALAVVIAALGVFLTLLAADTPTPSPRLVDYADQAAVEWNEWIVLAYTAYVLGPLLLPVFRDSRRNPLRFGRLASRLIFVGFVLSIARAIAYPLELRAGAEAFYIFELVTHVSTACVVLGLWAFAFARSRQLARKTFDTGLSIK